MYDSCLGFTLFHAPFGILLLYNIHIISHPLHFLRKIYRGTQTASKRTSERPTEQKKIKEIYAHELVAHIQL